MLTYRMMTTIALATMIPVCVLAQTDPVVPDFDAADFTTQGTNAWFPLTTGLVRRYIGTPTAVTDAADDEDDDPTEASDGDAAALPAEMGITTVLGLGPVVLGVQTITILDEDFALGLIAERTLDYFAADADGNIWYFGEDVLNYVYDDDGRMTGTNTDGSWLAGLDGAQPGIAMVAVPTKGMRLFLEYAPANEATDYFEVIALDQTVTGPAGTFTGVIQTFEGSTVDPQAREYKYWAPGVGLIRVEESLSTDMQPEAIVEIQP